MTAEPAVEATAYLALGSNVGDRASHLAHALRRLGEECDLTGVSSVFESDPVGYHDQPPFLNMVARVCCRRSPRELLDLSLEIEAERGRVRSFRGAPRTLDVDLLLHGERVVAEAGLEIPHPRMADRAFVLVPLLEVDPGAVEPGTKRPYADRLRDLVVAGRGARADEPLGSDVAAGLGLRVVMRGEELLDDTGS